MNCPIRIKTPLRLSTLAVLTALLSACGGGAGTSDGNSAQASEDATPELVDSVVSNATEVPQASVEAMTSALTLSETLLASQANANTGANAPSAQALEMGATTSDTITQVVACPGGGQATLTASGGDATSLRNGQFDTGEHYAVVFADCTDATAPLSLNGQFRVDVQSADSSTLVLATNSEQLAARTAQRTLTLNGQSTLSRQTQQQGAELTQAYRWQATQITLLSQRPAGGARYTLSDLDLQRSLRFDNSNLQSSTRSGQATLAANLPNASWSVTLHSQGEATYANDGSLLGGNWQLVLPHNTLALVVTGETATVSVDYGSNGSVDKTYVFTRQHLADTAG